MHLAYLLILILPQPQAESSQSPSEIWKAAATDVQRLPADQAVNTRYLSLASIPPKDRERWVKLLQAHVNALSVMSDLTLPVTVTNTGGVLLRVDIREYGWKRETWERLAEADPYFHVRLKVGEGVGARVFWDGGLWPEFGREHARGLYQLDKPCKTEMTALAPWLTSTPDAFKAVKDLVAATQSGIPVIDGRFFFFETAIQADRKVGYYGMLGIKNQVDFERLVGFDRKDSERFTPELLGAVAKSGVAQQPRRISRHDKIGGSIWKTYDNRKAVGQRNPLQVLDNQNFEFDATEEYGHLSNGMWAVGLFDNKGERQDSAPDFIGPDKTATGNDGRIHIYLSCYRCHTDGGLHDFKEWARNLFKGPLTLQSPDYETLKKLRQQYLRKLESPMANDRNRYAEALMECNGMTPQQHASNIRELWRDYVDEPVTAEKAAADLGTTKEKFIDALRQDLRGGKYLATPLATYIQPGSDPLSLEQWFEVIPLAHAAIQAYVPSKN